MKENGFESEFVELVKSDKLDIFSIEDLMLDRIEKYKEHLNVQLEELLQRKINEGELIVKKNKNGKIVDIISITKAKKK